MTSAQKVVYDEIRKFLTKHSYSPTYTELGRLCGLKSLATVYRHLVHLKEQGYIDFERQSGRSIRIRMDKAVDGYTRCANGHEEIYFGERRKCPMCAQIAAIARTVEVGNPPSPSPVGGGVRGMMGEKQGDCKGGEEGEARGRGTVEITTSCGKLCK